MGVNKRRMSRINGAARAMIISILFIAGPAFALLAGGEPEIPESEQFRIAALVRKDSDPGELVVSGVRRAAERDRRARVSVVDPEEENLLPRQAVAELAENGYDLIVCGESWVRDCVLNAEEAQRTDFVALGAPSGGRENVYGLVFNLREHGFLLGHFAGLLTGSELSRAKESRLAGVLVPEGTAGDAAPGASELSAEAPERDGGFLGGFSLGFRSVQPRGRVLRRQVDFGDAEELREATSALASSGVDVIVPAGRTLPSVLLDAAERQGVYLLGRFPGSYAKRSGVVLGSGVLDYDTAAFDAVSAAMEGTLVFGSTRIVGTRDGLVGFDEQHRLYEKHVPEEIREEQSRLIERLRQGELVLEYQQDS
jgi:basic membrane lipoprotein Med (substrate-binding protein (PBP1-ABC) superfamily)